MGRAREGKAGGSERLTGALVLTVALAGCGQAPPPEPVPTEVVAAAPAPDPRIAEMQILLNELLDRLEVMNSRLQRLESGTAVAEPAASTRPAAPATAAAPAPSRPAPRAPAPPSSAVIGDRYREALTLYGKGRIDDARAAFQQIFDADPGGDLADNALYWIGETYFVQARFADAIEIYRRIVAEYGSQNKAPDAMLKIGLAQARLGDLAMARSTFQGLLQAYPYSTPAATARHELERIKY